MKKPPNSEPRRRRTRPGEQPGEASRSPTPKRPRPGDDNVTLPQLPSEWTGLPPGDRGAEIDQECNLTLYLYLLGEYHALPAEKKRNLIAALYGECDAVMEAVERQLRLTVSLSGDARIAYLDRYQAFCRRYIEAAGEILDTGHCEARTTELLFSEHIDLLEQMGLVRDLDLAALKAANAKLKLLKPDFLSHTLDFAPATVPQPAGADGKPGINKKQSVPADIISTAVATKEFNVSRVTIRRAIGDRRLTDYRPEGHADNAPFQLSRAAVAALWPERGK